MPLSAARMNKFKVVVSFESVEKVVKGHTLTQSHTEKVDRYCFLREKNQQFSSTFEAIRDY